MVGLSTDDSKLLEQQLQDAAGAFALESSVCVFNLVGMCQEFLLEHNDAAKKTAVDLDAKLQQEQQEQQAAAEAAAGKGCGCSEAEAQSLWHEMQQRMLQQAAQGDAELSTGAGIGTLSSNVLGEDLWMFNAGLFSDEGEQPFSCSSSRDALTRCTSLRSVVKNLADLCCRQPTTALNAVTPDV